MVGVVVVLVHGHVRVDLVKGVICIGCDRGRSLVQVLLMIVSVATVCIAAR